MLRLFTIALGVTFALTASAADWRPVSPEELSLKQSKVDPNADAEALFRDVRVLNEAATFGYPHNVIYEYIRLKIFTERGRDRYATVKIPYWGKNIISNVEGRTIRPDGSVIELQRDAVFDKVLVNKSGFKTRIISFALPGVEPGAVIEYRWTDNVGEFISRYLPLEVQSEFPIDHLTFHIKPVSGVYVSWPIMRFMPFGCNIDAVAAEQNGFSSIALHNIPAFREEPYMPPEYGAKQWLLIYYEENTHTGGDKYWNALGKQFYTEYNEKVKVNGEIKDLAREQISGAATDPEKLDRLLDYCRKNVKDVNGAEITTEQREGKTKANYTTVDILRRKQGDKQDIDLAFVALARAAGFEATMARLADRATFLFNPNFQSAYFLNATEVAVKVNGAWKFYAPSNRDLASGDLPWHEQGVYALITDPKDPVFVTTPLRTSTESQLARSADLKLDAEGTLEGNIREYYSGNKATEWRNRFGLANDEEREAALRDVFQHRFGNFELSAVSFRVPADMTKMIGVLYHVKVPNYAQRTGKRFFVQPGFFEAGNGTRFTEETRQQSIYFDFPWSETEIVDIQLPDGFALDHADSPGKIGFAPIGSYGVTMSITKTNQLKYQRQFVFGTDKVLLFDAKAYPSLKQIFDKVHEGDNHMLTLKAESPKTEPATN